MAVSFPAGESALMLVVARLKHITSTGWEAKSYLDMDYIKDIILESAYYFVSSRIEKAKYY